MRAGFLLLALSILATDAATAQRTLVFEELRSDIEVLPDGDILVTETLRPRFTGSWNGIIRILSLRPPAAYGPDYLLEARLISATDPSGRALRHETSRVSRDSRQFKVWVPDAEDRTATVVLTYRVGNALGHFEADSLSDTPPWDELYWQATGTDWDVPILNATARIRLPEGARPTQATAYVGRAGSITTAEVRSDDRWVSTGPVGPLRPGEGLTLAVGWPAGFVARPAPGQRAAAPLFGTPNPLAAWPLLLPIVAFLLAYRAWDRRGRDPAELAVTTHWEPPANLTPAEAGTLVDHDAGIQDIVSTLVDLAVKGYLVIEEDRKQGFLAWGKEYTFRSVRPRSEWADLPEHERLFLEGLFAGAGTSVQLSDLKNEFYKSIPKIKDALQRTLVLKGYYLRRPDHVRRRWLVFAALAAAVGFSPGPMILMGPMAPPLTGVTLVVAAVLTAVILGAFGWIMPRRTESGARTREAVLGFKRFLERVEAPRYRRMITSPDVFEAYLPFAMAFGCEERWARAFEGLVREPPQWYRGSGMATFQPAAFAKDLGTLTTAASSTLSSSPSSSGSGGGGSVGGGGGGGGGGGF